MPFVLIVSEEIDSYLYQTVGQDAIDLIAKALDVPLHKRVISGLPIQQGFEYGTREASARIATPEDETEDLFVLLTEVKVIFTDSRLRISQSQTLTQSQHPEISGVSVGAILSNYQRVRVENVYAVLSIFRFTTQVCI